MEDAPEVDRLLPVFTRERHEVGVVGVPFTEQRVSTCGLCRQVVVATLVARQRTGGAAQPLSAAAICGARPTHHYVHHAIDSGSSGGGGPSCILRGPYIWRIPSAGVCALYVDVHVRIAVADHDGPLAVEVRIVQHLAVEARRVALGFDLLLAEVFECTHHVDKPV